MLSRFSMGLENRTRHLKYEIASVSENYEKTNKIYITVQVKGTSKTFYKAVSDLYSKEWLEEFSTEDVAHISFLYAAEKSDNLPLIQYFPQKKKRVTKNVVILGMLFVSVLILSNLTAFKVVSFDLDVISHLFGFGEGHSIQFPAALIFFPLTYFFDDTLTEVYGFSISRLIIWGGILCSTLFTIGTGLSIYLPVYSFWDESLGGGQKAYELVFSSSTRIFIASCLGYFFGEFINSMFLAKMKVLTNGKYLFYRIFGSTVLGAGIDSVIFCNIAFFGVLPTETIWWIILTQYGIKVSYEFLIYPVTKRIIKWLKESDEIDYYDFQTSFNPFSLKIEG